MQVSGERKAITEERHQVLRKRLDSGTTVQMAPYLYSKRPLICFLF